MDIEWVRKTRRVYFIYLIFFARLLSSYKEGRFLKLVPVSLVLQFLPLLKSSIVQVT